uniref:Plastid gamma-tocopherol O-methyltransferase protein n=1 Tax=Karenia brevis TaxID=156230 RepID=Q00GL4_KARBR|nr:plastid gamma-tocopherol O-methyltransferase protein precursor [Karenia brevis]
MGLVCWLPSLIILVLAVIFHQVVLPSTWTPLSAGDELYGGIAHFYDHSTSIWEKVWGEHLHAGWYSEGEDVSSWTQENHTEAQVRMMEQLLELWPWGVPDKSRLRVLDMGCGLGGSSRFLYRNLSALGVHVEVIGITLSPWQQERATAITNHSKDIPKGEVTFQVANALSTGFAAQSFDIIWSLESAEHFPTKDLWLREVHRLLVPGGTLLCATWCHRETAEKPLWDSEKVLLGRISKNYMLPDWVPLSEYGRLSNTLGFVGFEASQRSWTVNVIPFWRAVIWSALRPSTLLRVLVALPFGGWTLIKGAITALLMMQGFQEGTLNLGVFSVKKPKKKSK